MNIIGKEILNYRIISLIGKGGMGAVYLAEHKNISTQKAAIKIINAEMVNDFTRKMLKDEAEHLAGLHHHNIVSFLDFHIDKEGNIYLIMEYVEGVSLDSYIKNVNGLIVEDRICALFEPILDGVGYAHKKGILHRDIKPANIVIDTDNTPKILDFGIARIINKNAEDESDNLVMGTPSYMSPEQVKGEKLDERSDIYSLGVLLHQMLTGNAPYDTTTLSEQEINQKVVEEPLPRIRTYYKYVSDKTQAVVDKATAKNPEDRYQNCDEFKKALHNAIYPWKPKTWMKIAAAAVIALIIGGGCYIWDYNRTKVKYFKDYVEVWGVPQGVGQLSAKEHSHSHRSYKFVYKKRKLLRVSHVNSVDKLMDDGESERNERPIDQEFSYTDKGKVSRVIVKDRGGKVLYVKSYNDKLNTMAFQYNDEHGTERTISNKTVGYGRVLEQNYAGRGRISRWWIEYDKKGFVTTIKYAGLDNSPVSDENGIYGRTYVRDNKGRAVEIHYIGYNGEPQPTKWGLGIKKFYYDDKDNWVKAEYLTIDGQPAYDDEDGVAIYVMEYDKYGNIEYALHEAPDGTLMYPKKNVVAGAHYTYDNNGFEIKTEYLDADRKPMFVSGNGCAIVEKEYDKNGYVVKTSFFDPEGNPVECSGGYAWWTQVNDEHGNILESWNYSLDGKLCLGQDGYAGTKSEYDSVGNQIKIVYYGIDKNPCETSDGSVGNLYEYNDKSLVTKITNLGKDLNPTLNNNNIAVISYEYDKRGNMTKMSFFDVDGTTPVFSSEGTAGWNDVYDDMGNHIERNFFDIEGRMHMPSGIHYASKKYTYDDNGNILSEKFYDLQGKLTYVDGIAGNEYVVDKRGNHLEEKAIGTDGNLAPGKLIVRAQYDQFNNIVESALFNNRGAATNYDNIHRYTYTYNSRNQRIETRLYGTDGKLVISKEDHWAIQKNEYDDKGNLHKRFHFGTNEKPCKITEGWSSAIYEYDAFGHIIKQSFFNTEGNPTDPKEMPPVGICQYDKWGNMVFLAAQDGDGNYILKKNEKWAICRMEYDKRKNMTAISYFDTKDKPTLSNEGFHKKEIKYDKSDRLIEATFFGTDGKPSLVEGYHKETRKYAANSDQVTEYAFFGRNGSPIDCSYGFHKVVITYNKGGTTQLTRHYYKANGTLLAALKWNGRDWERIQQQQQTQQTQRSGSSSSWKDDVAEMSSECPYDFGADLMHLTMKSIKVTSDEDCEIKLVLPSHTKDQLSSELLDALKEGVRMITESIEEALGHKPYVTSKLYDKNGTLLYSVKI